MIIDGMDYSWTQPVCKIDWELREGERRPTRLQRPMREVCCVCGEGTLSGIYIRVDPSTVKYPTPRELM